MSTPHSRGSCVPDDYASVVDGPEIELRVKGSRFLGQVLRVSSEEQAAQSLGLIRRRHHSATHHCWAFRLAPPGVSRERFDDDGEPSSSAGPPILGAIRRAELYGLLVVVTRYFGGTKLGTGGLMRAYGAAAREAIEAAPKHRVWLDRWLCVRFDYPDLGAIEAVLARAVEAIHGSERLFDPEPKILVSVRRSRVEALAEALIEASAGRARVLLDPPPPNSAQGEPAVS